MPGSLLSSAPAAEASSLSLVWPLALAAVVGAALGFGAGYAVAIRDRPVAVAGLAPPAEIAAAPVAAVRRVELEAGAIESRPLPPAVRTGRGTGARAGRLRGPRRRWRRSSPAACWCVRRLPARACSSTATAAARRRPRSATSRAAPHQVRLVRDGYTTVERRIVITAAQPSVTLTVPMVKTPPAVPARTDVPLAIESKPSGAAVFLDGTPVGTTPLTFPLVKVGAHTVRITLEGYRPWSSSVQVSATEPNRVTASLER